MAREYLSTSTKKKKMKPSYIHDKIARIHGGLFVGASVHFPLFASWAALSGLVGGGSADCHSRRIDTALSLSLWLPLPPPSAALWGEASSLGFLPAHGGMMLCRRCSTFILLMPLALWCDMGFILFGTLRLVRIYESVLDWEKVHGGSLI